MAAQRRPDLQGSTTKQNFAVFILGVNKIAPKFVTLVATYVYVVRLFKDLTAQHIYIYIYVVALCILYMGQAFRYSPENAFYIFNQHIYFSI